jgi:hypothetical protein
MSSIVQKQHRSISTAAPLPSRCLGDTYKAPARCMVLGALGSNEVSRYHLLSRRPTQLLALHVHAVHQELVAAGGQRLQLPRLHRQAAEPLPPVRHLAMAR